MTSLEQRSPISRGRSLSTGCPPRYIPPHYLAKPTSKITSSPNHRRPSFSTEQTQSPSSPTVSPTPQLSLSTPTFSTLQLSLSTPTALSPAHSDNTTQQCARVSGDEVEEPSTTYLTTDIPPVANENPNQLFGEEGASDEKEASDDDTADNNGLAVVQADVQQSENEGPELEIDTRLKTTPLDDHTLTVAPETQDVPLQENQIINDVRTPDVQQSENEGPTELETDTPLQMTPLDDHTLTVAPETQDVPLQENHIINDVRTPDVQQSENEGPTELETDAPLQMTPILDNHTLTVTPGTQDVPLQENHIVDDVRTPDVQQPENEGPTELETDTPLKMTPTLDNHTLTVAPENQDVSSQENHIINDVRTPDVQQSENEEPTELETDTPLKMTPTLDNHTLTVAPENQDVSSQENHIVNDVRTPDVQQSENEEPTELETETPLKMTPTLDSHTLTVAPESQNVSSQENHIVNDVRAPTPSPKLSPLPSHDHDEASISTSQEPDAPEFGENTSLNFTGHHFGFDTSVVPDEHFADLSKDSEPQDHGPPKHHGNGPEEHGADDTRPPLLTLPTDGKLHSSLHGSRQPSRSSSAPSSTASSVASTASSHLPTHRLTRCRSATSESGSSQENKVNLDQVYSQSKPSIAPAPAPFSASSSTPLPSTSHLSASDFPSKHPAESHPPSATKSHDWVDPSDSGDGFVNHGMRKPIDFLGPLVESWPEWQCEKCQARNRRQALGCVACGNPRVIPGRMKGKGMGWLGEQMVLGKDEEKVDFVRMGNGPAPGSPASTRPTQETYAASGYRSDFNSPSPSTSTPELAREARQYEHDRGRSNDNQYQRGHQSSLNDSNHIEYLRLSSSGNKNSADKSESILQWQAFGKRKSENSNAFGKEESGTSGDREKIVDKPDDSVREFRQKDQQIWRDNNTSTKNNGSSSANGGDQRKRASEALEEPIHRDEGGLKLNPLNNTQYARYSDDATASLATQKTRLGLEPKTHNARLLDALNPIEAVEDKAGTNSHTHSPAHPAADQANGYATGKNTVNMWHHYVKLAEPSNFSKFVHAIESGSVYEEPKEVHDTKRDERQKGRLADDHYGKVTRDEGDNMRKGSEHGDRHDINGKNSRNEEDGWKKWKKYSDEHTQAPQTLSQTDEMDRGSGANTNDNERPFDPLIHGSLGSQHAPKDLKLNDARISYRRERDSQYQPLLDRTFGRSTLEGYQDWQHPTEHSNEKFQVNGNHNPGRESFDEYQGSHSRVPNHRHFDHGSQPYQVNQGVKGSAPVSSSTNGWGDVNTDSKKTTEIRDSGEPPKLLQQDAGVAHQLQKTPSSTFTCPSLGSSKEETPGAVLPHPSISISEREQRLVLQHNRERREWTAQLERLRMDLKREHGMREEAETNAAKMQAKIAKMESLLILNDLVFEDEE